MQYNQGITNPYLLQQQQSYSPQQYTQPYYGTAYQNAVPIGGAGYSGGYNFGYGYGYVSYDPLEIRRMQEEEEERRKREYNSGINLRKRLVRASEFYFNNGIVDQETLDSQYSLENMQKIYKREMHDMNMERLSYLNEVQQVQREQYYYQLAQTANSESNQSKNESLIEFLEGIATDRYMEMVVKAKYESQSRNIGRLYNHESFAELISMHNLNNNTNPIFNPMVTVDDLEILLPQKLKNEYEERRAQFIKAIVDSNPVRL